MEIRYLSTARFVKGKLLSFIEMAMHIGMNHVSSRHAGYTFVRQTSAINFRSSGAVGIYKDAHEHLSVIKDYAYTLKNLDYEYLHNEIHTLRILNQHTPEHSKTQVPALTHTDDDGRRITIVTKYANGRTLEHFLQAVIGDVLLNVLTYLKTQSGMLTAPQRAALPKRVSALTVFSYHAYLFRALMKEPSKFVLFIQASALFYRCIPAILFNRVPLSLNHRDLSADNILYDLKTSTSTILDTECMVLGDPLTDVALIPRLYIRYLDATHMLTIFHALHLSRSDVTRLTGLMISGCIIKIATETKNTRDYDNAVSGLSLVMTVLAPGVHASL